MLKLLALLSAANLINPTDAQPPATFFSQATLPAQPAFSSSMASFPTAPLAGSTQMAVQTFPSVNNFPSTQSFPLFGQWGVRSLSQLSPQEIQNQVLVHQRYVTPAVRAMHSWWHGENGQGGTRGEGSGDAVIVMHYAMLLRLKALGGPNFQIVPLVPGEIIPAALSAAGVASSIGAIPDYLTTRGGILPDSNLFVSLNTIDTLDKLGRVMSRIHRELHLQLGGSMAEIERSIEIPLFWNLHEAFQAIVDQWLATNAGRTWSARNPTHEIFNPRLDPASYTNAFFARGNTGCGAGQADALCQELARWDRETAQARTTAVGGIFTQPFGAQPPMMQRPPMIPRGRPLPPRMRGPRG